MPDNYTERMMKLKGFRRIVPEREVKTPEGFAIAIAYNKSGYQVIPREDLKHETQ